MSDRLLSLGDCGTWLSGGTPSRAVSSYWTGDIPWISAATLKRFFVKSSDQCVTAEGIEHGSRLVQADTILMLVRGMSLKTEFRMGIAQRPIAFNQDIKALIPGDGIDPYYLAYAIRAATTDVLDMVEEAGHGTGVLPTERLKSLQIWVPDERIQSAIAALMRALDTKIEVIDETNRALESMAQALFKSWFVDFDPVIANREGRTPYGMDVETAALFPKHFWDSELGLIPDGWHVRRLGAIVDLLRDAVTPHDCPSETFAHYSIPAFDEGRTAVYESGGQIHSNKYLVPEGVVLVSKLNPDTPRVWWPDESVAARRICSTEFLVFRPRESFDREYIFELAWSDDFLTELASLVTGTSNSHQRVKPDDCLDMRIVTPELPVVTQYSEVVRPWLALARANQKELATLSSLRDTLLSQLLSGEIRLKDAEKFVGEAV